MPQPFLRQPLAIVLASLLAAGGARAGDDSTATPAFSIPGYATPTIDELRIDIRSRTGCSSWVHSVSLIQSLHSSPRCVSGSCREMS